MNPELKDNPERMKTLSETKTESLADNVLTGESVTTTTSEWDTLSDGPAQPSETATIETPTVGRQKVQSAASASRKRGRHKEYTAPTGVWKTNGGYISTIYVGNRRIYGPLRDNPEEAGVDRQKLIEAKSFAKTEVDMRNFIATLKGGVIVKQPITHEAELSAAISSPKRRKPLLTTISSAPTTIVAQQEDDDVKQEVQCSSVTDVPPPTTL